MRFKCHFNCKRWKGGLFYVMIGQNPMICSCICVYYSGQIKHLSKIRNSAINY